MARRPSKPATDRGPLHILTTSEALPPAHRSEGTLDSGNGRKRATTDTNAAAFFSSHQSLLHRRSKAGNPLPLDLSDTTFPAKNKSHPHHSASVSSHPSVADGYKSAPIDIPNPKPPRSSQPTTPLTGRVPPKPLEDYFKSLPRSRNHPTSSPDSQSQSSQSEREPSILSPIGQRNMRIDRRGSSPLHTPSPTLSPTMPVQSIPAVTQPSVRPASGKQPDRRQPGPLAIPSLPALHPANYESRTSSPRTSHPTSFPHGRQTSDAQKKLQQYQHDLVVNYTRNAVRNTGKSPLAQPSSPRLNPLGNSGPITPLMLEGQGDYFLSGSRKGSRSASNGNNERREMAERVIGVEKDRIRHPERVERHSPAVSPVGGPG